MCPEPRIWVRSSSRPMRNMKKMSPICARIPRTPVTDDGNRNAVTSGRTSPSRLGPRRMPAVISPITRGWPIRWKAVPRRRAAAITTATARRIRDRSSPPVSCSPTAWPPAVVSAAAIETGNVMPPANISPSRPPPSITTPVTTAGTDPRLESSAHEPVSSAAPVRRSTWPPTSFGPRSRSSAPRGRAWMSMKTPDWTKPTRSPRHCSPPPATSPTGPAWGAGVIWLPTGSISNNPSPSIRKMLE